jgi:hypothetical protein
MSRGGQGDGAASPVESYVNLHHDMGEAVVDLYEIDVLDQSSPTTIARRHKRLSASAVTYLEDGMMAYFGWPEARDIFTSAIANAFGAAKLSPILRNSRRPGMSSAGSGWPSAAPAM